MSDSPTSGAASRRRFLAQAAAVVSVAVVPLPVSAMPAATALGWSKQDIRPGEEPPKSPEPTRTSDRPGVSVSLSTSSSQAPYYPGVTSSTSQTRMPAPAASASSSRVVTTTPIRDRAAEEQLQQRQTPRKGVEFF